MAQEEYWSMWKGAVVKNYEVYISCNECHRSSGKIVARLFPVVQLCFRPPFIHFPLNNQTVTIMGIVQTINATVIKV